jgi:hypothetical protein
MNSSTDRLLNRPRWTALVLVAGGVLGLLAACSSDENPAPGKPPVVNTGGGGGKAGAGDSDAGESSGGSAQGGRAQGGGSQGGNAGEAGEGGSAGEGGGAGEAGAAPVDPSCPTTDLGFLNQPSNSQKSVFDNTKRLGAHPTLPPLP